MPPATRGKRRARPPCPCRDAGAVLSGGRGSTCRIAARRLATRRRRTGGVPTARGLRGDGDQEEVTAGLTRHGAARTKNSRQSRHPRGQGFRSTPGAIGRLVTSQPANGCRSPAFGLAALDAMTFRRSRHAAVPDGASITGESGTDSPPVSRLAAGRKLWDFPQRVKIAFPTRRGRVQVVWATKLPAEAAAITATHSRWSRRVVDRLPGNARAARAEGRRPRCPYFLPPVTNRVTAPANNECWQGHAGEEDLTSIRERALP